MTPEKIINEIVEAWIPEFIEKRKEGVKKAGLVGSLELINSFRANFNPQSESQNAKMQFIFATHGRYQDMKAVKFDRMPNVNKIENYVRKKGVEAFRAKHQSHRKYIPGDQEQLIKDIAFGISMGILKKGRIKRRRWYNKSSYKGIQILYRRLLDGLSGFSKEEIINSLALKN